MTVTHQKILDLLGYDRLHGALTARDIHGGQGTQTRIGQALGATQLGLHRHAMRMHVFYHPPRGSNVALQFLCRRIDHHRRETQRDRFFDQFKRLRVIQMQADGHRRLHFFQLNPELLRELRQRQVIPLQLDLGDLHDDGRLCRFGGAQNRRDKRRIARPILCDVLRGCFPRSHTAQEPPIWVV